MRFLLFTALLTLGCKTTQVDSGDKTTPLDKHMYKVGDCLMIIDIANGEKYSRHRVRIEKIENNRYYYRWLLENKWDSGLSTGVGKFEILEKISKRVNDCP